jgi:dTDP-4-amino-4,6-dideoxygalactose transaminase
MSNKPIPYGKQNITPDDIEAMTAVLQSDYLTQGPKILEFEQNFANYIGCKYAVAAANGTAALHLCALAVGVTENDKVITTPITFAASANCIRYCRGEVTFVDIDPDSYLIDINKVEEALKSAPKGTYKGIIPVDFAGRAVNMEALRKLADEYNLWVIEDACQHIACGEGGMITTNNETLYKKLLQLRTHGIIKDENGYTNSKEFATGEPDAETYPGWYMEMQTLGYNYRLTDFQAALGISQLKRADEGLIKRKHIAGKYEQAFKNQTYIKGQSGVIEGHAYHLYVIETEDRVGLYNYLRTQDIFAQIHYIPCHLMPYYKQFGWKEGDMPNAELYYKGCISLPMYPTLTNAEQDFVINRINSFFEK